MLVLRFQKTAFSFTFLAALTLASCGEKAADTTADQHEGIDQSEHAAMENKAVPTKEVVDVPDYAAAGEPVKGQVSSLLNNYLKLKDALVASNAQTAQAEAKEVVKAAEQIKVSTLEGEQKDFAQEKIDEVKQSASKIAQASDVNAQRAHLELLSEATFSLTKAFKAVDQTLYYQHCPMANNDQGAYWLSSTKEIRNPYFGEKMLNCGGTEEVLN